MDRDDNEDDNEDSNEAPDVIDDDDVDVEEEEFEEQEIEPQDSWISFQERIDAMMDEKKCAPDIKNLDSRRYDIKLRCHERGKIKEKTLADRARKQKTAIEKQLEMSSKRLGELLRFGRELVTNIKVANECREYERRNSEIGIRKQLLEDLKGESIESMAKFDDITARWTELSEYNEPMALWEEIEEQRKRIDEIMKSKDQMIERCQREIERINDKFNMDMDMHSTDIACLVERVDHQIELLKDSYKNHVRLLEDTIEDERQIFRLTAEEKWRTYFTSMENDFREKLQAIKRREDFYRFQVQRISEEQEELTKSTRIRLEKDCELLELELRKTRDSVLMNSEKLDYNYQVLQKRNEENIIVTNQQKRRVAKLHEGIVELRKKVYNTKEQTNLHIIKLSEEIKKLHETITDMESKSHQMRMLNKHKFDRVWDINYKELMSHVHRVYEIDRLLHEQQLVMPWEQPHIDLTDVNKMPTPASERLRRLCDWRRKKPRPPDIERLPPDTLRLMRNIIRKLSGRGSFLIEERLLELIEPFDEKERCLVRLDNIFTALRVTSLRDIAELTTAFEPFTYCPNCQAGLARDQCAEIFLREGIGRNSERKVSVIQRSTNQKNRGIIKSTLQFKTGDDAFVCPNHYFVMESTLVVHAMCTFTTNKQKLLFHGDSDVNLRFLNYITIDEDTVRNFWHDFRQCMPPYKLKLWKTLEHGLNHFIEVLKMREQYDRECVGLRKQNNELKYLLQKFQV